MNVSCNNGWVKASRENDILLQEIKLCSHASSLFSSYCCNEKAIRLIECHRPGAHCNELIISDCVPFPRFFRVFILFFFLQQVQYCCETCRDAGWNEYHRIECGILSYLEPSKYLGKMPHLALR